MPTKTINDLTNTVDILDGDELAFWNLANSRTDKITYANFKADLLGLAADTEILFINGTAIDGDSRLTYNPTTNVFSLGGDFNINGNSIINTGTLTLPTSTDTLVGRATTDTLTNKSIDANGTGNVITNIGDAEIEAHTSTKITITDKSQLNSNIVYTDQDNTYGAFAQVFPSGQLQLNNLANTFQYIFTGSAILADRAVTLPLLVAPDTFVMEGFGQTLTNKTFDSTSNVWRTSGTSTLTALATISRSTNNLDLDNLLITDSFIELSVNLHMNSNLIFSGNMAMEWNTNDNSFFNATQNGTWSFGEAAFTGVPSTSNFAITWDRANNKVLLRTLGEADFTLGGQTMAWSATGIAVTLGAGDIFSISVGDLSIIDTADTTFSTSKMLTRDAGGVVNTISASGGGTANFLNANGAWAPVLIANGTTSITSNTLIAIAAGTNLTISGTAADSDTISTIFGDKTFSTTGVDAATGDNYSFSVNGSGGMTYLFLNGSDLASKTFNKNNLTYAWTKATVGLDTIHSMTRQTSGTLAVGIGAATEILLEATAGAHVAYRVETTMTNIGSGTEASDVVFQRQVGGATTTFFSASDTDGIKFFENLTIEALNIITDTTTGMKIGTSTTQKLGFFNSTPIIQQTTTSQTPATFVANSSGIVDDTGTWNGYTIGDLVAILQAFGFIA